MNPALVLACNNVELTEKCVDSLLAQDIWVTVFLFDNGSTDGTQRWSATRGDVRYHRSEQNLGFSRGMNEGMSWVFSAWDENGQPPEWCLAPNNDTILPPHYYRLLLEQNMPVVSGVQHINGHRVTMEDLTMVPPIEPVKPHPDFSALLFRRWAWEALSGFDESMVNYASDNDMHIRAHLKGIAMNHVHVPFFHYGSATIRNGDPMFRRQVESNNDVGTFRKKWGCTPSDDTYNALFVPEMFGIQK